MQMKKFLNAFNEGLPIDDQISWEAASNIHRHAHKARLASTDSIPLEVKHEAIQKFRSIKRSLEETELLKKEMRNTLEYYQKQIILLKDNQKSLWQINDDQQDPQKLSGCSSLISRKIGVFTNKLSHLKFLFSRLVPGTMHSTYV